MSAIAEFVAKQTAFNARQSAAVDALGVSINGISGDIAELNRKIEELQNSPGGITPEDQALLDGLQTAGEALATRTEGVAAAVAALDALTPPATPVPPP